MHSSNSRIDYPTNFFNAPIPFELLHKFKIFIIFYSGFIILNYLFWLRVVFPCKDFLSFSASPEGFLKTSIFVLLSLVIGCDDTWELVFFKVLLFKLSMLDTAFPLLSDHNDIVIFMSWSLSSYFLSSPTFWVKFYKHFIKSLYNFDLIFSTFPSLILLNIGCNSVDSPSGRPSTGKELLKSYSFPYRIATVLRKTMKLPYTTFAFLLYAP